MTEQLLSTLAALPGTTPFVGPDQAALQAMLAQITGDDRLPQPAHSVAAN
jgi:hypothetical protein